MSKFLTRPGICLCGHEATEYASSSAEFWHNADTVRAETGWPIFGNSDSANIYVLPALLAARPMTKVIWIERPMIEVKRSMERAGFDFPDSTAKTLIFLRDRYQDLIDFVVSYQDLAAVGYCRALWDYLLGCPFDYAWWNSMAGTRFAYDVSTLPPKDTAKFLSFIMNEMEAPESWLTRR
jgi:hypothetical protein